MDIRWWKRGRWKDYHQVSIIYPRIPLLTHPLISCSLAIQLSKVRASVLLISTDPAHNLSDAFSQKFGKDPTLVTGFENLYAMEIDPTATMDDLAKDTAERDKIAASSSEREPKSEENPLSSLFNSGLMSELSTSIPGADEAMGFAQVMKLVKSLEFSVIVFDTAPTGHTLRFLSFPRIMEKALGKLVDLTGKFGGMMQQVRDVLRKNLFFYSFLVLWDAWNEY